MAQGDVTRFNEANAEDYFAGWAASDTIKIAILDNTTTPADTDVTPALADYTEVGTAGTYVAGGTSLGTWGDFSQQLSGTGKIDSATNPTWTGDASNDTDAYWGLIYNDTQAGDPAMFFVDLGGPIDMTADLTITWAGAGIETTTKSP